MTQNGTDVMARADEYARRVEEALADLPQGQRKQLLADLAAHLAEITDDGRPVVDQLGPPEEYARELRAAADLVPAEPRGWVSRTPWRDRRAAVIAAIAVVAVLTLVGFLMFRALNTGETATASTVPVPNVIGLSQGLA